MLSPNDVRAEEAWPDEIAAFITGVCALDLAALNTDASHVVIASDGATTSLYVEHTPGTFDPSHRPRDLLPQRERHFHERSHDRYGPVFVTASSADA